MADDNARVSRFREHTNTAGSIRAPPEELWKTVGADTEALMDAYAEESTRPASGGRAKRLVWGAVKEPGHTTHEMDETEGLDEGDAGRKPRRIAPHRAPRKNSVVTLATAEGTFNRFSRAFASVLSSVLGKRKAADDHEDGPPADVSPEQALLDERKRAAEAAYHLAKAQGLLPAPTVYVRPGLAARAASAGTSSTSPARTPGSVARSPSKRDLSKQRRLSRRVSSLEIKLASARAELARLAGGEGEEVPMVPPVPDVPAGFDGFEAGPERGERGGGKRRRVLDDDAAVSSDSDAEPVEASTVLRDAVQQPEPQQHGPPQDDLHHHDPPAAEPNPNLEPEPEPDPEPQHPEPSRAPKRIRKSRAQKQKRARSRREQVPHAHTDEEDEVVVVRPGGGVPPVPLLPKGVEGRRVGVFGGSKGGGQGQGEGEGGHEHEQGEGKGGEKREKRDNVDAEADDGYGGLGHEMF
ncbi:hypothetical protein C7974DRAFT_447622 [Boeremia exigua]|uniref:uncharacterized protein n=1 Tax=Boeremia exigua TaxID=749465 RepID=UPI001E8E116B|nr:uncharacterized protein C7974DRAFT_447622 [Boeremia exigua]KAH6642806.1 hypothetical protein C7974DRAFT_447622 [Boeremia exigua]